MKKTKVTIFDKPQWFDLDNYKSVEDLSAVEWFEQLLHREYLYSNLGKSIKDAGMDLRREINDLTEEPIFRISAEVSKEFDKREKAYNKHIDEMRGSGAGLYQDTISPLTCFRVHQLLFYLPTRFRRCFDNWQRPRLNKDKEHYFYKLIDDTLAKRETLLFPEHVHPESIKYISVDLNAPDRKIISDLEAYLEAARKRYSLREGNKVKPSIIQQLLDNRVLPYLDLKLWYEHSGHKVARHVIGEWLFPGEDVDTTEKVRRSTEPLAKRALTQEFISTLRLSGK